MTIGKGDVLHVAKLAELHVADHEVGALVTQLNGIVDFVAQLASADVPAGPPEFTDGPLASSNTLFASVPVIMKPPIRMLSPVCTRARVEILRSCAGVGVSPGLVTVFESRVTAPVTARSRPVTLVPLTVVTDA